MNSALINAKEMNVSEIADNLRELTSGASIRSAEVDKVVFDNGYTVKLYAVDSDGVELESDEWHRPDVRESTHPDIINDIVVRGYEDCDYDYIETTVTIDVMSDGMCVASAPCVARTYYNTNNDCAVYLHVEGEDGAYSRTKILVD